MGTYDAIEGVVKRRRPTRPPKQDLALQAFVGAILLSERQLGVDTLTTAARLVGVSRSTMSAAVALLKYRDADLVARVLSGRGVIASGRQRSAPRSPYGPGAYRALRSCRRVQARQRQPRR